MTAPITAAVHTKMTIQYDGLLVRLGVRACNDKATSAPVMDIE
jgi:hypothetical protein